MCFKVIFFDLDETLYPPNTGIWQAIGRRMDEYIINRLMISVDQVSLLREELFQQYGTTLRGLREVYKIDESEFLAYVHDIPIENYLRQDGILGETLSRISARKVIFTNADTGHAHRVLSNLGIEGSFDQVIDIQAIHPYCKPMVEAFEVALKVAGIKDPAECVMIDDSERNLLTAHELGFFTIRVGSVERPPHVDAAIADIHSLADVIPVSVIQ